MTDETGYYCSNCLAYHTDRRTVFNHTGIEPHKKRKQTLPIDHEIPIQIPFQDNQEDVWDNNESDDSIEFNEGNCVY